MPKSSRAAGNSAPAKRKGAGRSPAALTDVQEAEILAALSKAGSSSAALIADATEIPLKSVRQILARLETAQRVSRQPGSGTPHGRAPDLWTPTTSNAGQGLEGHSPGSPRTKDSPCDTGQKDESPAEPKTRADVGVASSADRPADDRSKTPDPAGPDSPTSNETAVDASADVPRRRDAKPDKHPTGPHPAAAGHGHGNGDPQGEAETAGTGIEMGEPASRPPGARRPPGALRVLAQQYLSDNPTKEVTAGEVARALTTQTERDVSPGAISNALDRLVHTGEAIRIEGRPVRFRALQASTPQDPATPEGARSE